MILLETLRTVVNDQKRELGTLPLGLPRELLVKIETRLPHALVISGIRRCGKSTLLRQLMKQLPNHGYLGFEDTRLADFAVQDFAKLTEVFQEIYPAAEYYCFDEIQNAPSWERYVRTLLDREKKCLLTGSNASLLSRELGSRLTGRHVTYELFPFSYREMIHFTKQEPGLVSVQKYLHQGGFPEYLASGKTEVLQQLFEDIIMRDIVVRHKLREAKIVKEMALYLITNMGKEFSYNKLAAYLQLGSPNTAIAYVSYFEDSYLLFIVPRFDFSYKKQLLGPKKIYCIDGGLARAVSVSFSSEEGRALENLAYLHLRRSYKDIYYFKGERECDFIVCDRHKPLLAVQVCLTLNEENKERELGGLREALASTKAAKGIIVTLNQEDQLGDVPIVPIWKWIK